MCVHLLRNSVINQFVYLQIRYYACKLIEKLPIDKCNERSLLRNYLQINVMWAIF